MLMALLSATAIASLQKLVIHKGFKDAMAERKLPSRKACSAHVNPVHVKSQ